MKQKLMRECKVFFIFLLLFFHFLRESRKNVDFHFHLVVNYFFVVNIFFPLCCIYTLFCIIYFSFYFILLFLQFRFQFYSRTQWEPHNFWKKKSEIIIFLNKIEIKGFFCSFHFNNLLFCENFSIRKIVFHDVVDFSFLLIFSFECSFFGFHFN